MEEFKVIVDSKDCPHIEAADFGGNECAYYKDDREPNCVCCRYNCNIQENYLYNEALEWAASWIEGSLVGETSERVIEFTKAQAMSIRAAKKPLS